MSRTMYVIFASSDNLNFQQLGEVEANSAQQARKLAYEGDKGVHAWYAATPARSWSSESPEVETRPPVLKWKKPIKGQMTVDDVLGDTPKPSAPPAAPSSERAAESRSTSATT